MPDYSGAPPVRAGPGRAGHRRPRGRRRCTSTCGYCNSSPAPAPDRSEETILDAGARGTIDPRGGRQRGIPGPGWPRCSGRVPRPRRTPSPRWAMPTSTARGCGRYARPNANAPGPSPTSCAARALPRAPLRVQPGRPVPVDEGRLPRPVRADRRTGPIGKVGAGRRDVGRGRHQRPIRRVPGAPVGARQTILRRGVRGRDPRAVDSGRVRLLGRPAPDRQPGRRHRAHHPEDELERHQPLFPHSTFWWEGHDGSRVLAHFPPANTYNGDFSVRELTQSQHNYRDHGRSERSLYPYGYGDGGGGPTSPMLEYARRLADLEGLPRVEIGTVAEFLDRVRAEATDLATWVGELYLEAHRATLTTLAEVKRANRRGEEALRAAEMWSVAAGLDRRRARPGLETVAAPTVPRHHSGLQHSLGLPGHRPGSRRGGGRRRRGDHRGARGAGRRRPAGRPAWSRSTPVPTIAPRSSISAAAWRSCRCRPAAGPPSTSAPQLRTSAR
jgi:hypothetical protein